MRSRFELVCYLAGLPETANLIAECREREIGSAEAQGIAADALALRRLIIGHIAAPRLCETDSPKKTNDP
jgi:hypothetical protein